MKTNKQSKIKVKNSGYRRSRFNWSHDVNTTFGWGEIQPTMCKMLIPGSKTTVETQNLIRLAPMVAPTFGRVKYKTFSQFVAMTEVFPNFDAMMAQEPKSTAYGTKVPKQIPHIQLGKLSSYILSGARATLYWVDPTQSDADRASLAAKGAYKTQYVPVTGIVPTEASVMLGNVSASDGSKPIMTASTTIAGMSYMSGMPLGTSFLNSSRVRLVLPHIGSVGAVYAGDSATEQAYVILGTQNHYNLLPISRQADESDLTNVPATEREVTFDSADYVLEFTVVDSANKTQYYALALECSDYGKRLRKIIQGCGYQIDFASTRRVSILPLLAQYKAYFDVFGLQLYQGWETTYAAKMIKFIENEFVDNLEASSHVVPCWGATNFTLNDKIFAYFMFFELGQEFYTEDADYIGANISSLSVSPIVDNTKFISVDSNGIGNAKITVPSNTVVDDSGAVLPAEQVDAGAGTSTVSTNTIYNGAQGFINQIQHGQVDAELLKRMYRWVNRNTILGREIAKILRAQGLGKYVDECKSNFIGSTDTMITISDVISQAATDKAVLGEYGGRGLQYDATGTLVFENDVYGYWITLATVVPEAGYTQGMDPTLAVYDKFDFYNPDFDALGMEATTKDTLVASRYICGSNQAGYNTAKTFGFIPRMSKFKVTQNLTNGDFNRHNMRNTYMPYTLDKQINVNDFEQVYQKWAPVSGSVPESNYVALAKSIESENLPVAGNIWRTPTKYRWIGNFDRIFYDTFDDGRSPADKYNQEDVKDGVLIGFGQYNNDNFMSHSIYGMNCYAPMKPIEDSYGLDDSDAGVTGDEFVSKA